MPSSWHSYASGAFTRISRKNDKGLYATMKRWVYRPFIVS